MRLMLAVRAALKETDWDSIMEGVRGYAKYCEASGKAGSEFVKAPISFFEEGIYAEELEYKQPADPKIIERRRLEEEHMRRAVGRAIQAGSALRPYPQESAASFETRVSLAESCPNRGERRMDGSHEANPLGTRIASLADRLRVSK